MSAAATGLESTPNDKADKPCREVGRALAAEGIKYEVTLPRSPLEDIQWEVEWKRCEVGANPVESGVGVLSAPAGDRNIFCSPAGCTLRLIYSPGNMPGSSMAGCEKLAWIQTPKEKRA